jgi:N4-gp56 family major capsid protein
MADSTFSTVAGAEVTEDVWTDDYLIEFVRDSGIFRYMGKDENAIIQVQMELAQKAGDDLTVTVFLRLVGAGVSGDNTLRSNEEAARNFGYKLTVNQLRNAVAVGKHESHKSRHDLLKVYKTPLKLWSIEALRDTVFSDLGSGSVDGKTPYASCSEAEKDAFIQANSDRVTFGALVSNYSSGDHDTALATLDATNDTFTPDNLALAKRRIKAAGQDTGHRIRPTKVMGGEEWQVAFVSSLAFRDFETSSDMENAHLYAANRGKDNPLFSGGDLTRRGVIVHEEESLDTIADVGDSGTVDVTQIPILGAQAHVIAWKEKPHGIEDDWDYGNGRGVGIAEDRGSGRLMVDNVMHGMGILWVASQPDS